MNPVNPARRSSALARCLGALLVLLSLASAPPAWAAGGSLIDFVRGQKALSKAERSAWERAVRLRFGGAALDAETPSRPELGVAKEVLSAAIFAQVKPKAAARAAWEGWRNTLGYVPPPIAAHYWSRALVGKKPKGRPIDLAFDFPKYFDEEIAPDLVAYWEEALKSGKIPEDMRAETRRALSATRKKMRPLLIEKLRVMARLEKDLEDPALPEADRAQIKRDLKGLQAELRRSFSKVAASKRVLSEKRSAYARLKIQLRADKKRLTAEDRALRPLSRAAKRRLARAAKKAQKAERRAAKKAARASRDKRTHSKRRRASRSARGKRASGASKRERRAAAKPPSSGARATRLQTAIRPWLGTPYAWGRARRGVGTDCSGFTQAIFRSAFQLPLPRTSRDQARLGRRVKKRQLSIGDLVFFDTAGRGRITHVGVYTGGGRFAHASSSRGVRYDKLSSRYFRRAYRGARRLL